MDRGAAGPASDPQDAPHQVELIGAILEDSRDFEEFLELYYWSREPEVLSLFRSLAQLPLPTRKALEFFFSQGGDCAVPSMESESGGWRLTLRSDARPARQTDSRTLPA